MRFLDPKEEVYKVKITPWGKYLLTQGKFNPTYYAFFDDDIIYDSSFLSGTGDSTELQNDIKDRILDETPKFEGQTSFQGSETTIFYNFKNKLDEIFPGVSDKIKDASYNINNAASPTNMYYLQKPLAKSGNNTDTAPYFIINMLTGTIVDAKLDGSGSSDYFAKKGDGPSAFISQVEFEIKDQITIDTTGDPTITPTQDLLGNDELFDSYYVFKNGTKMTYDKKELFLKLEEDNTEFLKENFEIEVFEIQTYLDDKTNTDKESLKKLSFIKENEEITKDNVEYYFNILVDNQIDPEFYCRVLANNENKTKDIFSDNTFKCPDIKQEKFNLNIYNTDKETTSSEKC